MSKALTPAVGNSCLAVVGSGKLAVDGARGVGVLAKVPLQDTWAWRSGFNATVVSPGEMEFKSPSRPRLASKRTWRGDEGERCKHNVVTYQALVAGLRESDFG